MRGLILRGIGGKRYELLLSASAKIPLREQSEPSIVVLGIFGYLCRDINGCKIGEDSLVVIDHGNQLVPELIREGQIRDTNAHACHLGGVTRADALLGCPDRLIGGTLLGFFLELAVHFEMEIKHQVRTVRDLDPV